jgi:hypothetical protein
MKDAVQVLIGLLDEGGWPDLFINYPISLSINRALSAAADLRFVWGGDAKVDELVTMPLRLGLVLNSG